MNKVIIKSSKKLKGNEIQIESNSTISQVFIGNTGRMYVIKDSNDIENFYFKPAETKDEKRNISHAYIQEVAYRIQNLVNPERAVKCNVCEINGVLGAIQEKIDINKEATKKFYNYFKYNVGKLNIKIINQIMEEFIVDYVLFNFDAHFNNFVIDKNGNLRGIDKEESLGNINKKDKNYIGMKTIYNVIFDKIESGELSYNILDSLSNPIEKLTQISDTEYKEIFRDYAYELIKKPKSVEKLLDQILKRKKVMSEKLGLLKRNIYVNNEKQRKNKNRYNKNKGMDILEI